MNDARSVILDRLRTEFQGCDIRTDEGEVVLYCGTKAWTIPFGTHSLDAEIANARAWFAYR